MPGGPHATAGKRRAGTGEPCAPAGGDGSPERAPRRRGIAARSKKTAARSRATGPRSEAAGTRDRETDARDETTAAPHETTASFVAAIASRHVAIDACDGEIVKRSRTIAMHLEATAARIGATASFVEAIASHLGAIASALEAIASNLEAIDLCCQAIDPCREAIVASGRAIGLATGGRGDFTAISVGRRLGRRFYTENRLHATMRVRPLSVAKLSSGTAGRAAGGQRGQPPTGPKFAGHGRPGQDRPGVTCNKQRRDPVGIGALFCHCFP